MRFNDKRNTMIRCNYFVWLLKWEKRIFLYRLYNYIRSFTFVSRSFSHVFNDAALLQYPWRAVFYRQKLIGRYVKLVKCDASRLSTLLSLFHSGSLTINYRKYCSNIASMQLQVYMLIFFITAFLLFIFQSTAKNNQTFFAFLYTSLLHARVNYRSLSVI